MEGLGVYASSDDELAPSPRSTDTSNLSLPFVNSAPFVAITDSEEQRNKTAFMIAASQTQLTVNLPIDTTLAPFVGPHGGNSTNLALMNPLRVGSGKEIVTGVVEHAEMEDYTFEAQYHTHNQTISQNPSRHRVKGAPPPPPTLPGEIIPDTIVASGEEDVFTRRNAKRKNQTSLKARALAENVGDENVTGVWAPYKEKGIFLTDAEKGTMNEQQKMLQEEHEVKRRKTEGKTEMDEEMDFDRMVEKKLSHLLPARLKAGQTALEGKSTFLGDNEYDYQGRAWVEPPRTLKPDDGDHQVFLPKKCIHKWMGHTKGVQAIELFPKYGHLLLSGSMDNTVRIWDVYNERKCQRIYEGHSGAVRGINFSTDGKQFLSCSFDRFIQLWDTETGQAVHSFTTRRVPYCVKFYPVDNTQFVVGDSNHMVVQFDTRSGEIVQEYNHHLQAVNSVTFVDDNTRFVSSSDDKKVLVWEWGIPVPIKYISEPSMHSMPAVTLHPSGAFFAGQSLNNQIDVYTARDKFKLNRKKVFRGHQNAGYACQIGFSPNGQYIMSGDGEGKLVFWDWKSTKQLKKLRAHDRGPTMGAIWHPLESSKVVTCGWDGLIKYWD
ncbi:mRNA splicing factor [Plasmopara halstedii]|uniref:Pre-mRNA-processing factor 17 n=1 Tax=Plasmopara halstedii TaxID=4781 RepID=A0A0P1B6D4_PLAHL|nr:mRNA splicing factor [Plasmopara halstedii]CEG49789.1 mRNA splicing factor [Plasmopara halstedii]|eukprot:XP_024586158.1 mRNA splicing factor [Plasmopara halstedii]